MPRPLPGGVPEASAHLSAALAALSVSQSRSGCDVIEQLLVVKRALERDWKGEEREEEEMEEEEEEEEMEEGEGKGEVEEEMCYFKGELFVVLRLCVSV